VETEIKSVPLSDWKTYLRWNAVHSRAAYLSTPFVKENFDFYSKTLRGVKEIAPRWKRCVRLRRPRPGRGAGAGVRPPHVHRGHQSEDRGHDAAHRDGDGERIKTLDWMTPATAPWTSTVFPGTQRDYWVYVPAQYRADTPAAVMVFQDGGRFVAEDGRWRIPVVFDNLIHRGEMPVTVGVFVDPGVVPTRAPTSSPLQPQLRVRRSRRPLRPVPARGAATRGGKSLNLTGDPNLRAIGGASSGGICAFTVAWNRPDAFRRVLSFIGSYTGLRAGDTYPTLVRKTEPRPIRVFLQDGTHDLNIYSGNWWSEPGDGQRPRVRGLRPPLHPGRPRPR